MQPNHVSVHHFPNHKLSQFLHKNCFKMTYITGTINLQSLFCRRDFLGLPWREFILFTVFISEFPFFVLYFVFALSGGLKRECVIVSQLGGEGVRRHALNWENLSLKYSQIPEGGFKINKQCIDTNVQCLKREVYNLKQQGTANKNAANIGSTRDFLHFIYTGLRACVI